MYVGGVEFLSGGYQGWEGLSWGLGQALPGRWGRLPSAGWGGVGLGR